MDLTSILTANASAIPNEIAHLVELLLEGRITGLAIVYETLDGGIGDGFKFDIDGASTNAFAMLGGMEILKRDIMRTCVGSRVEYVEKPDETDGSE